MMTAASSPDPATSPTTTPSLPSGQDEHVVPVPAHGAGAGDVPRRQVEARHAGQRRRQQAAVQRHRGQGVVLRHHGVQGERRPVGGHLQQLGVLLPERPPAQRADVQHADDLAAGEQGHAEQGLDAPVDQQRVPHRGVVHRGQDDRLAGRRDPAGEAGAQRDAHALPDLFLDAARGGRDQLPGGPVQQQHRRGVRLEHLLHPLEQGPEQRLLIQPGQRGVRHRFNVTQPVSGHFLPVPTPPKGTSTRPSYPCVPRRAMPGAPQGLVG